MSDLTAAQWSAIEKASVYLPSDRIGRYIGLGKLREIIRKSRRSNDQNALLWSLYGDVLRLGGEMLAGWTTDDLHEFALGEFFGWDVSEAFGRKRMKPKRRSSRLTKAEFSDFVDAFVRLMAGHGIVLTLPGEIDGQTSRI
jgi:hypothetical protein